MTKTCLECDAPVSTRTNRCRLHRCPAWCPDEYAALHRKMENEGFTLAERKQIIDDDIAARVRRLEREMA